MNTRIQPERSQDESSQKLWSKQRRLFLFRAGRTALGSSLAASAAYGLGPWIRTAKSQARHHIRWVVPTPPGSSVDIAARRIAERLRDLDGRTHIVENKPGAGNHCRE